MAIPEAEIRGRATERYKTIVSRWFLSLCCPSLSLPLTLCAKSQCVFVYLHLRFSKCIHNEDVTTSGFSLLFLQKAHPFGHKQTHSRAYKITHTHWRTPYGAYEDMKWCTGKWLIANRNWYKKMCFVLHLSISLFGTHTLPLCVCFVCFFL